MPKVKKDQHKEEPTSKEKYRVKNWSSYNQSLINRGKITVYFTEDVIDAWYDDGPAQRGAQFEYSDMCIESLLMLKVVFKLTYRQTQGFATSLLSLINFSSLSIPSYTQLCRRSKSLEIDALALPKGGGPITLAFDSTGLKVYGEGEWKVRKHGWSKRRTWRKLHLGCDPDTGYIHCVSLTDNSADDGSQLEPMLDQVEADVEEGYLDGAYDTESCWDELVSRSINPVIPPRTNAVPWYADEPGDLVDYPRNKAIERIDKVGRKQWKQESNYHRRSLSETAMFRFKIIHGRHLYSRKMETQTTEAKIKIKALNIMTAQGMPDTVKIQRA